MHIAAPEPWARRVGGPTLLPSHHTTQCVISVSAWACTAPTALRPDGGGGRRKVCWLQTPSPPATTRSRHSRHSTINHRVRRGSGCERSPRQWLHAAARMRHAAAVHAMRHRRTRVGPARPTTTANAASAASHRCQRRRPDRRPGRESLAQRARSRARRSGAVPARAPARWDPSAGEAAHNCPDPSAREAAHNCLRHAKEQLRGAASRRRSKLWRTVPPTKHGCQRAG